VALQLPVGLHCLLILLLLELHFFCSGVQFLSEHSGKFHLLLELDVPWIGFRLHMDVGRSTSSLRKMGILRSIQELAMMRTSDHVSLMSNITNSSIEGTSWSDGGMDLLGLKNSSEGLGVKM
jgi:hypothetical protein